MTRAPLPGKLPEWPEWQEDDLDYAGYYHELAICWESRARLAVEALQAIERDDLEDNPLTIRQLYDFARDTLDDLGPLPEEDRT